MAPLAASSVRGFEGARSAWDARTLALAGLEAISRGATFATIGLFVSTRASALDATAAASVATVSVVGRALLRSEALGRALGRRWLELVDDVRTRDVRALSAPGRDDRVTELVNAAYEVAHDDAVTRPELLGIGIAVGALGVLAVLRLGVGVVGLGVALGAVVALVLAPLRHAVRRARRSGWAAHLRAGGGLEALFGGALELRSQGLEPRFVEALRRDVESLVAHHRAGARLGALTGLVPAVVAFAAPLVPRAWLASVVGDRGPELAVFAVAGASLAWALVGSLEAIARTAPLRESLQAFGVARVGGVVGRSREPVDSARRPARLVVTDLAVRHPGAPVDTPASVSFKVERGGLAIVGPNGAGKSSLAAALLGLLAPVRGSIAWSDADGRPVPIDVVRANALVVPQRPFVAPALDARWHLTRFGTTHVDDAHVRSALGRLGLAPSSASDATVESLLQSPMGRLSGGERQRLFLARTQLFDCGVIVLDEPEAGLDQEGRRVLLGLLEELANERIVLLIAHDLGVVPASYRRVAVSQGPSDADG
jgi:ABC-type transport system involved in cytochrome bd biosynthesis fused ATPase/permease subunit